MRTPWIVSLLGLVSLSAWGQEQVAVLSREPIEQRIGIPRQVCSEAGAGVSPSCSTQTFFESRTTGYRVSYELRGTRYTVELPYDPGANLLVSDAPWPVTGASPIVQTLPVSQVTQVPSPAIVVSSPVASVIPTAPTYIVEPASAVPSMLVPFTLGLGLGLWWHGGGYVFNHGHRHWRWR